MSDNGDLKQNYGMARSRLDGRPRHRPALPDPFDLRVQKWLLAAHRSFRSWTTVAGVFGISSKGKAQHIAEGRAPVTPQLRDLYRQHLAFRAAGRKLRQLERREHN